MALPLLILASGSPRRAELLRRMGREFTVVTAPTPESHDEHLTPREICLLNAHRKARAVAKRHPDSLVIGADTIVCLGTKVYGKPKDFADAEATLSELAGRTHQVMTGVCLMHLRQHRERLFAEVTQVTFRVLSPLDITEYLQLIHPLDKAGGYAIQEHGDRIVAKVEGSFDNVVGFPTERIEAELAGW